MTLWSIRENRSYSFLLEAIHAGGPRPEGTAAPSRHDVTWKAAVPRRRIRLKDHPKGAETRARLETLPRAARVRWWRVNAGRIKEGKDGEGET